MWPLRIATTCSVSLLKTVALRSFPPVNILLVSAPWISRDRIPGILALWRPCKRKSLYKDTQWSCIKTNSVISFKDYIPQQGWGAELLSIFLSFFYTKAVSPSVTVIHTTIPDSYTVLSHTMMTKIKPWFSKPCCDNISTKFKITFNSQIKLIISTYYYNMFWQTWASSCNT